MADETRDQQLLRNRLLGWAPACDPLDQIGPAEPGSSRALTGTTTLGRDLRLARGPGGLDLARVAGMDTLAQALAIALTTLRGSDVFNTDFGFDGLNAMVEEVTPLLVRERIRVAVIDVLRRDPRVRRIVDVKLDDGRLDAVEGAAAAPADADQGERQRQSRELGVRLVFETITGDQATVALGRLIPNG